MTNLYGIGRRMGNALFDLPSMRCVENPLEMNLAPPTLISNLYGMQFGRPPPLRRSQKPLVEACHEHSVICNLNKKGIQLNLTCPLFNDGNESVDHMVMHCNVMKMALFSS